MKVRGLIAKSILLSCPLWLLHSLWAQDPQPEPPATQQREAIRFEVPEPYKTRMAREGTILELSLNEAIRLALTNNLEIAIENYNEDLTREQLVGTRGFFDPTLSFTVGYNTSERPTTSTLQAGSGILVNTADGLTLNAQYRQNVKGGGLLDARFNNSRFVTNSVFSTINPRYDSDLNVTFTQPIWRGFLQTNTQRQLKLINLDSEISDTQFKQRVAEVVQQVQNQYWELVFSIENYETQRKSMELAIIQHRNNRKRVEIGVMAPIEITSSEAEVARREQGLIQSEVQIINSQNALKRLLAPDPEASIWNLTLIPTEQPSVKDVSLTLEEAIRVAIANRPELERVQLQMEQNEVNRAFYKNDGKPAINLRANLQTLGASGNVFRDSFIDTDGDGIPDSRGPLLPDPTDPRFGGFGTSFGQTFGFDFISWGIFADIIIPLKNRTNEADLATTAIRERQLQSTLKNQQQMVIVEVRNAFESLQTRRKSLAAARLARQLAEEQLAGENKRFEAGLSTNFEVLRFQRDLAENQVSELRALVDYELALIALQKAMYTIIEDSDISMARQEANGD